MSNPTPAQHGAVGFGLATLAPDGSVLDTWYPAPELIPARDDGEAGSRPAAETTRVAPDDAVSRLGADAAKALGPDDLRGVEVVAVRTAHRRPVRRRPPTPTTSGCGCTCSATGSSSRTAPAWTACSAC